MCLVYLLLEYSAVETNVARLQIIQKISVSSSGGSQRRPWGDGSNPPYGVEIIFLIGVFMQKLNHYSLYLV